MPIASKSLNKITEGLPLIARPPTRELTMDIAIAEKRHDMPGLRNGQHSEERFGKRYYKAAWQALDRDFVKSRMFNHNNLSNSEIKRRFDEIRQTKELIRKKNEALSVKSPFRD